MFFLPRPSHFAENQRDPKPEHLLLLYPSGFVKPVILHISFGISHLPLVKSFNPDIS